MKITIISSPITEPTQDWGRILQAAYEMMDMGFEPRSALKQCANDAGIPYGDEMLQFVLWAESQWS